MTSVVALSDETLDELEAHARAGVPEPAPQPSLGSRLLVGLVVLLGIGLCLGLFLALIRVALWGFGF